MISTAAPSTALPADPGLPGVPSSETPFHRMGRTTQYRWWRPVVGTVIVLAGIYVALPMPTVIVRRVFGYGGDLPVIGAMTEFVLGQAGVALILPLVLAVTRWIDARPVGTLASVAGRLRWRWLGLCLLVAVPIVVAIIVGGVLLTILTSATSAAPPRDPADVPLLSFHTVGGLITLVATLAVTMTVAVALTVVQSATEEYATRGWILQAVGGFTRGPWLPIAAQAVVFTVPHGLNGSVWGYTGLILYALIIGWLTVSTGGIEAGIALHVAFNGAVTVLACLAVIVLGTPAPGRGDNLASASWQAPIALLLGGAVYALAIHAVARRWFARR